MSIEILTPWYTGRDLWHKLEPVTKAEVWFVVYLHPTFSASHYPRHAQEAVVRYHETLMALLSAGF